MGCNELVGESRGSDCLLVSLGYGLRGKLEIRVDKGILWGEEINFGLERNVQYIAGWIIITH